MKRHSDNIQVSAGQIAIKGINVFPEYPLTATGFEEMVTNALSMAERIQKQMKEDRLIGPSGQADWLTLPALSTPLFYKIESDEVRNVFGLRAGIVVWGNLLITNKSRICVSKNCDSVVVSEAETVDSVEIQVTQLTYDTYNGADLMELDQSVIDALIEDGDRSILTGIETGPVGETIVGVKYQSIYAPLLSSKMKAPVIGYVSRLGEGDDVLIDFPQFDRFMVRFIDTSQPFAYITVETFDTESEEPTSDFYGAAFESTVKDAILAIEGGYDGVIADLRDVLVLI